MELVTNGKTLLFINRPIAYSGKRKGLGPRQMQYLRDRGWIDNRIVQRKECAP